MTKKKVLVIRLTLNLIALAVLIPLAVPIFGSRFRAMPATLTPLKIQLDPSPTLIVSPGSVLPTAAPSPQSTHSPVQKPSSPPPGSDQPWGVAKQVGEYSWTMKVAQDPHMATPKEILDALNEYRRLKGASVLMWDQKLADYAQQRADGFDAKQALDEHAGFKDFLDHQDGFDKLGFTRLGENASFGYRLNGTHLIEWIYAGDQPHDDNQKDSRWAYVGIGVKGTATCLIFGTGKM